MAQQRRSKTRLVANLCAALLAPGLAGCMAASAPIAVRPLAVEVPVAVRCPSPPTLKPPALPIATLRDDSDSVQTARAYAATVELLKAAVAERDAILDSYRAGQ